MALAMMLVATVFQAPNRAEAAIPPPATLTQTFYGTLISKIGPNNQGVTRPVVVTVKSVESVNSFGGFNGNITEVKVVSSSPTPGNGDVRVNTTTAGWTRTPGNTSRFVLTSPSDAASQVYINGAWRQLKRTAGKDTVIATFADGGSRLRLNISGQAATGSGTTITAVEITNLTTGLDAAPLVVSSSPLSGTTVGTGAMPSFIFSEPVTVPSNAFTLSCNNLPVSFVLTGSGTTTLKLTPSSVLPEGATCRATVNAALAADVDTLDDPNLGSGSESFTFVTDVRPSVVNYTPTANGDHPVNASPQVTFSEPVSLAAGAITMMCGEGDTQIPVIVTMNPARTIATVKPLQSLPGDSSCRVTVKGNLVTDLDTADAPDTMLGEHGYSFMTDAAPYVANIETGSNNGSIVANTPPPSSGSQTHWAFPYDVATNEEFGIFFSELVTLDSGAITVTCNGAPQQILLDSGYGNGLWVVSPSTSWPAGSYCTGTIAALKVHDADTVDPLDTMAANVTFSFQIDAAPYVVSSNPSNNGGYFPGSPISVTFSEAVSVSSASLLCYGHTYPLAPQPSVSQDGKTWTWTGDLASVVQTSNGQSGPANCVFTINALDVEDNDYLDPPSKMANTFTLTLSVETAPYVTNIAISPMVGDTAGPNPTFTVTFSEKVNINNPSHAFTLSCDGEPYSLSGGTVINKNSATLTASNIGGPECTFTVVAEYVSDADSIDPPDHPYHNESRTFSTDQAPYILYTLPENGGTMPDAGYPENPWGVLLVWSEPIVMGEGSFSIVCGPSNTVIPSDVLDLGEDSDTGEYAVAIYTEANLEDYQGQTCTVSVTGANVSDVDASDPPDHSENYSYTVTIDSPPSVTSVEVLGDSDTSEGYLSESSSTTISTGARFRVNFSEPVDVVNGAFNLYCGSSYSIDFDVVDSFEYMSEEVTSIIITMSSESIIGAEGLSCTMDLSDDPDGVVDSDIYDTPNDIDRSYSWDFEFDEAPKLLEGSTIDANGVISLTFSESVDIEMGMNIEFMCNSVGVGGFSIDGVSPEFTTWTFTPSAAIDPGSSCTLTIPAMYITDEDDVDAPDNPAVDVEVTLSLDEAPAVVLANSTPSAQYQAVESSDTIEIAFNEDVFVDGNGISATCDGTPVAVGVGQNESDTSEITPVGGNPWGPEGAHCELTIDKDVVTDRDEVDPPDVMEEDFVLHFVVGEDAPPALVDWAFTSIDHLELYFSEGVTLGVNYPAPFPTVICNSSQQNYSIQFTAEPDTWEFLIQTGMIPGAVCQLTIAKENVTDNDLFDAPNIPLADIVIDFTVDAAPEVVSAQSSPSTDGLIVAANKPVTIMFSEKVFADSDSFEVTCGAATPAFTVTSDSGNEEYTLTPVTTWGTLAASCTYTVVAEEVTDADMNDAPDNMDTDFVRTFIVGEADEAPTLDSDTHEDGFGTFTLVFSEAVDMWDPLESTCRHASLSIL